MFCRLNLFLLMTLAFIIKGQVCPVVSFSHDACGNRIQRSLQVIPCSAPSSKLGNLNLKNDTLIDKNITETENRTIKIFPNPTLYEINLEWVNQQNYNVNEIRIIDQTGKTLYNKKDINEYSMMEQINISGYVQGIYYLLVIYSDKKSRTYKIIKK